MPFPSSNQQCQSNEGSQSTELYGLYVKKEIKKQRTLIIQKCSWNNCVRLIGHCGWGSTWPQTYCNMNLAGVALSVLWRCWPGGRKGIWPVNTESCYDSGGDVTVTSIICCCSKARSRSAYWYCITQVVLKLAVKWLVFVKTAGMVELSTPTIQTLVIAATSAVVGCVYFTWKPWMVQCAWRSVDIIAEGSHHHVSCKWNTGWLSTDHRHTGRTYAGVSVGPALHKNIHCTLLLF